MKINSGKISLSFLPVGDSVQYVWKSFIDKLDTWELGNVQEKDPLAKYFSWL